MVWVEPTGTGPEILDLGSSISSVTGCAEKALNALAAVTATLDTFSGVMWKGVQYCAVFSNNYLTLSSKIWCPGLHPSPYLLLGVWGRDGAFAVLRFASGEGRCLWLFFCH